VRKHRKLLVAIACLAVVAACVVVLSRDGEPHYQDRSLSFWLDAWGQNALVQDSDFQAADRAIHAIGTNAIPTMLRWICEDPAPWKQTAKLLPSCHDERGFVVWFS